MSPEPLGVVVETPQGTFCVDPEDQFVSKALLEKGVYADHELIRLAGMVRPHWKVLLVGAHIGALLVPLSRRVASIVGIEANPATYRRLQLNLLMNQCGNVRVYNVAAGDSAGPIAFVLNRVNSGGSKRMPKVRNELYFRDDPQVVEVPSVRLDDLLPDETFELVFMDIEGSEALAMRGMPRILAGAKLVFAEFYPQLIRDVAGVGVDDFLAPLADFNTLGVPSLKRIVHREDFHALLSEMFEKNLSDNGIFFIRDRVNVRFGP